MIRKFLTGCALLAVLLLAAGCSAEPTPYEINNAQDYRVSVRFDAGEGIFTTNTSVIVDSFRVSGVPQADGKTSIALIPPDHEARGNDAFAAVNNGYFLAGWYAERTGEPGSYIYANPWNFETDRLQVDVAGDYTSEEPVLTLYAAWVPMFRVDFADRTTGEILGSYTFDPTRDAQLQIPAWDRETGTLNMYKFPARSGYTFENAYYNAEGTRSVGEGALTHSGSVDYATGTAVNNAMTVYVDWMEGEWYHIYNVEQFLDNASVSGSYILHADLDFTDEIWPTSLMYGSFSGTIQGNGHTISNVNVTQTNNSNVNAGMFGRLAETAVLSDVTFENVTFTIKSGTRVAGTSYGLLAGAIADTAQLSGVEIRNSLLAVDANAYFGTEDYSIGLLSGMGTADVIWDITCTVVGESDPQLYAVADGSGMVTLTDIPPETPAE